MSKHFEKKEKRLKRLKKHRVKMRSLNATRLVVSRSNKNIYAQIIQPGISDTVVASASTVDKEFKSSNNGADSISLNKDTATLIGKLVAKRALEKGVDKVSFDRSGYKYHGKIKALADAAREEGLQF